MSLIPTLKLWLWELGRLGGPAVALERAQANAQGQVREFMEAGGELLFGTDVGYMTDYDPTDEYVYMQKAGLPYAAILAALTTAPASRLGAGAQTGQLVVGLAADVVVLDGDPSQDIRALGRVRATLRNGRIIYRATP